VVRRHNDRDDVRGIYDREIRALSLQVRPATAHRLDPDHLAIELR
jgi:hypothetical protein